MKNSSLLNANDTAKHKALLNNAVSTLLQITQKIDHKELEKTVTDIKERIDDPFMFVIAGEVKAGKSSFINALLDANKEICKVAASPMTDTIQQIVYGDKESITDINEYLKRITQPVEILKEIAIVDTPGTNTIVDHHQEITERFIPSSDLIVFVFESKNPYRQSAWDFFEFIKDEWKKKIIFILQQKDLMVPEDLVTNINGVKEYAVKQGIKDPKVFPVSALMELNGEKEESGFKPVRKYIQDNITGGKAPFLKILNNAETALNINDKIYKGVIIRKEQFQSDSRFRTDIRDTLDKQEEKTKRQVDQLVENLLASYDRITNKKKEKLKGGVGVVSMLRRSISSKFGKTKSPKEWFDALAADLEKDLNTEFKDKLREGVVDIADSIQTMGKLIDAKIKNSETILKDNHEIFSDIAERRANVLRDLQETFSGFLKSSENFYNRELIHGADDIAPNLAKGGGIAIIGMILTTLTSTIALDVTGGILTAIGFVFAGVTVGLNRSKIIKGYETEVANGRERIKEEITIKLNEYTTKIKNRINDNFVRFDQLLEEEQKTITYLEEEHHRITAEISQVKQEVAQMV
jgi:GTPase SAR1 family protein